MNTTARYTHTEAMHNLAAPQQMVPILHRFLQPKSVIDVGCGIGTFLKVFKEQGCEVLGVDGDYVDKNLLYKYLQPDEFLVHDLEKPLRLNKKFDLCLSLEVAEHLSAQAADIFVESLVHLSDCIVFSAAMPLPGQGGDGHINEQFPSYWQKKFAQHGYVFHDVLRPVFWEMEEVFWWYKQNSFLVTTSDYLLDFQKLPKSSNVMALIHPDLYFLKVKDEGFFQRWKRKLFGK